MPREQIRPAPSLTTGEAAYFSGVVNRRRAEREPQQPPQQERRRPVESNDEGIFMLLDLDAILSSKEKITLAGLGEAETRFDANPGSARVGVDPRGHPPPPGGRGLAGGVGGRRHAGGAALAQAPSALVLDVAVGGRLAYEVVEEARKHASTRVVLIASIYNRTGYKRRPTSLYGADDYVEQHHIPDALVPKLSSIGDPPAPVPAPPPHQETPKAAPSAPPARAARSAAARARSGAAGRAPWRG